MLGQVHSVNYLCGQVDDQMYAQPLVKLNLAIPGYGNKNVVFVATVNNTIYAFDADSANVSTPYWQINLTPANSRVISRNDETGACGGFYRDLQLIWVLSVRRSSIQQRILCMSLPEALILLVVQKISHNIYMRSI